MSQTATQGHPRGLYILFVTEMWERFSYYGMRAIFMLFLTKALLLSGKDASNIYGSFTGLVYLTPLIGGYISDRYWGNRRSIFIGGILMAIGQILLFMSGNSLGSAISNPLMLGGLTMLIVGNGFFKPNISTMVGQLYPKNDGRLDGAFTIFYMGINLGALIAPLVCGYFGDTDDINDFKWGFLAAGVGMIISVITFELTKNKYIVDPEGNPVGLPPTVSKARQEDKSVTTPVNFGKLGIIVGTGLVLMLLFYYQFGMDIIGSFIFTCSIAVPAIIITDSSLEKNEKERIWVIFILAFFVIFFWSAFEQAGASLTIFADQQTDRTIGGWEMPASWFQSINPFGIILLAPLFSGLWVSMSRKKIEPSSPLKMAMGLGLLCLGYVVIAFGVNGVDSSTKISMWWLISLYALHTMGELCLSPIGLSMVSKLAPIRFSSLLMGTWFLANAAANKLAGSLSALIPPAPGEVGPEGYPSILGFEITNLFQFFNIFLIMSGGAAILLFVLYRRLIKLMHGVN